MKEGIESLDSAKLTLRERGEGVDGETVVNELLAKLQQVKEVRSIRFNYGQQLEMSDRSPLIYRKAKGNKIINFFAASLSVLFGVFMFINVPIVPYNYIFLAISVIFPFLSIIDDHYLSIIDGKIKYSSLTIRWEVELSDVAEWKIFRGTCGIDSHLLEIRTKSGKRRCVPSLISLGIRDPNKFAKDFAKCIRDIKKEIKSQNDMN